MPEVKSQPVRPRRFHSLKTALTTAFLALSVTPLIVVSGLELVFNFRAQQEAMASQTLLVAQRAADSVSRQLDAKMSVLSTVAASSDLLLAVDAGNRKDILGRITGLDPSFNQVVLWDNDGREMTRVCRGAEVDCRRSYKELDKTATEQVAAGASSFGAVYLDKESGEPMTVLVVPVLNVYGELQGILSAEIRLKFMWDLVSSLRVGESGTAYVVDERGDLIAHVDSSRVLKRENLAGIEEVDRFLRDEDQTVTNPVVTRGIEGGSVVASHVALTNPHWAVIVEIPALEAYAGVIAVAFQSVLVLVLGIATSILIGLYLARRITNPILRLRDAVERMRQGDLETTIVAEANNEIGDVATAFNLMVGRLNSYTKELIEEHSRFTSAIKSIPFGFFAVDKGGELISSNGALRDMLGLEWPPMSQDDLVRGFGSSFDVRGAIDACLNKPEPREYQDIAFRDRSFRLFMSPIVTELGNEVVGAAALMEDISERRALEMAKGDFLAIASHEMRTPLTIIRGAAELLRDSMGKKANKVMTGKMIDSIERNAARLLGVVNDFLDLTVIEEKRLNFNNRPFDIIALVEETIGELDKVTERKGVYLKLSKNTRPVSPVFADRDRTKQVLVNIISNALRYTEKGGVTVAVSDGGNQVVRVEVSDTGSGIERDKQDMLFQKFSTVRRSFMRSKEYGSGLGLYICKVLMEGMGGSIGLVRSEMGVGSVFRVDFPVASEIQKEDS